MLSERRSVNVWWMIKATHQSICRTNVTLYPFYRRVDWPHAQFLVTERLINDPWRLDELKAQCWRNEIKSCCDYFYNTSKTKCNKSHLLHNSAYNRRYNKTPFLDLERTELSQFFAIKLRVRTLPYKENFDWRQTLPVARNSVSKVCDCLDI
jgi:hypothetical protein